jgi:hypothetical protein
MAMRKTAVRAKKMMAWTKMEAPLVWKLPNSTKRPPLAGSCSSSPGESSTNSTTATTTGPQSDISNQPSLYSCSSSSSLVSLSNSLSAVSRLQGRRESCSLSYKSKPRSERASSPADRRPQPKPNQTGVDLVCSWCW